MRERIATVVALAAALAFGGTSAWAGTTNQNYSTTVASLGGYGYTAFQTKAITGTAGYLGSGTVGGSYVVSARTNSP